MPYVLENLEDGKAPSVRAVARAEDAPGAVVVEEAPAGYVWDASSGALRPPTEAENLEEAKAYKIEEFAARGISDLAPLFTPNAGRDETMLLLAAHVLKICEALSIPADPRLSEVVSTGQKALAKKAEVEAASTLEELEGVEWIQQS